MRLVIESKRDQRVLDWLVLQVGEQAVANACKQLVGARRAYVSNVAKVLNLVPPTDLAFASSDDVQRHLDAIHRLLGSVQISGGGNG